MARTLLLLGFALIAWGSVGAQDFGFDAPSEDSVPTSGAVFSGDLRFGGRAYLGTHPDTDAAVSAPASAVVRADVTAAGADLGLALRLDPEVLTSDPVRVLDELSLKSYWGDNLEVTAGLTKLSWGKADSLRVLDVVNPLDYTDFVNAPLEDRKIAQGLFDLTLRTGDAGKLEAVYVPFFQGDSFPLEGTWAPQAFTDLRAQVRSGFYSGSNPSANGGLGNGAYAAAYSVAYNSAFVAAVNAALAAGAPNWEAARLAVSGNSTTMATLQAQADAMAKAQATAQVDTLVDNVLSLPDTKTLAWGQGGFRYTDSFFGVDWGLQTYTGFLRAPVYSTAELATTQKIIVDYNRYYQAGAEAAFVVLDLNVRAEGAWHQTSDLKGDDPLVRNPFASASLGFDRTFGDLSLNLQGLGTWTANLDEATKSGDSEAEAEDWAATGAAQAAYAFWNGKAEVSTAVSARYPDLDWVVLPALKVKPVDDLSVIVEGKLFGGKAEGQLGQYADRSFVEVRLETSF